MKYSKDIFYQLNIKRQCEKYGLSLWQCPQFLFLVMGCFIIIVSVVSYLLGIRFIVDPEIVALIVLIVAAILFVISFIIIKNFERLAEVSRMKSEFINIISHQLRSPLVNLKWSLDFLNLKKAEIDAEKREEYYSILQDNIKRIIELVNDITLISRLQEGENASIKKQKIVLSNIILDLISQFKFFADSLNIKIEYDIASDLPKVLADPFYMRLAIENLISNAVCYSSKNGIIKISLKKENNNILFKIEDSGIGIPEEDQKYIFQKFFRAKNAFNKKTDGSGLGLFIAKSIIEKFGGRIWFEPKKDKGSIFYFTLPINN